MRAVCRSAKLNSRYFYESFSDVDSLLVAVYDWQMEELSALVSSAVQDAGDDIGQQTRAGIGTVMRFVTEDPRRGRVLFTEGRAREPLATRRRDQLALFMEMVMLKGHQFVPERHWDSNTAAIVASMFAGAMTELVQSWLEGRLGNDLEAVIDRAAALTQLGESEVLHLSTRSLSTGSVSKQQGRRAP